MTDHVAGDIARNLANAPVSRPDDSAEKGKGKGKPKGNPLSAHFGAPVFKLNANPKWYKPGSRVPLKDVTQEPEANCRVADVELTIGGIETISASIYMERAIVQGASGRKLQRYLRFSFPKAIKIAEAMSEHVETFKLAMVAAFQDWQSTTGTTSATSARSTNGVVTLPEENLD